MSSSSWTDVVIPSLLIVAWLIISPLPLQVLSWIRPNLKLLSLSRVYPSWNSNKDSPVSGYILPVLIHHARMLPKESQHSFRYPSLFLALKLDDLEAGKIQLNRVFSYTPLDNRWNLSKLDPDGFGRRSFPGIDSQSKMNEIVSKSILLKLLYELRLRNYTSVGPQDVNQIEKVNPWDREVGEIWAIAMPTLLGMGGFNPLTVYYVHRPRDFSENEADDQKNNKGLKVGKLWLVVLEVHNTFNERHVYICQVGVDEDQEKRKDYQHSWTFAREFHVSPFNDRLGYYQLLMNNLWNENENDDKEAIPTLDVRLLLLSPTDEEEKLPKLNKKLLATLMSSQAKSNSLKPTRIGLSISKMNMLRALSAQPFDLVLPVSRIMWEAAKLHWKKGLPVFIRPEQRGQGIEDDKQQQQQLETLSYDGLDWPVDLNPIQKNGKREKKQTAASGSIYWNQDSFLEKACQLQFERYIQQQSIKHDDISFAILSRNAEVSPCYFYKGNKHIAQARHDNIKQLSLYTLSSTFYFDFALYTPNQARLFGSLMDRNWGVSSVEDFNTLLSLDSQNDKARGWKEATATWARRTHMQWALRQGIASSSSVNGGDKDNIARKLVIDVASRHPYNSMNTPLSFLLALLLHIFIIRLTAALSALLHIRYVRAPWSQVAEGYQRLIKETQ